MCLNWAQFYSWMCTIARFWSDSLQLLHPRFDFTLSGRTPKQRRSSSCASLPTKLKSQPVLCRLIEQSTSAAFPWPYFSFAFESSVSQKVDGKELVLLLEDAPHLKKFWRAKHLTWVGVGGEKKKISTFPCRWPRQLVLFIIILRGLNDWRNLLIIP